MKTAGIICEYNPFHSGHLSHFTRLREAGFERIVCLMSGNFVERGEPALFSRYRRAECALAAGADLVLELPFPYSSASAEYFAGAGVRIFGRVGIDALSFGTETGDLDLLERLADVTAREDFPELVRKESATHPEKGIAAVWAEVAGALAGVSHHLSPNDLLAVAYLRAMKQEHAGFGVYPVLRDGSGYAEKTLTVGRHPSATALRRVILEEASSATDDTETLDRLAGCIPLQTLPILRHAVEEGEAPVSPDALGALLLPVLRLTSPEAAARYAELSGGFAERLIRAAGSATTYKELLTEVATKKYTDTRIRRAILFAAIGVTPEDLRIPPAFCRVLAANEAGCSLLAGLRKTDNSGFFVSKPADIPTTEAALRQAALDCRADALYTLAMPKRRESGWFLRQSPVIRKNDRARLPGIDN